MRRQPTQPCSYWVKVPTWQTQLYAKTDSRLFKQHKRGASKETECFTLPMLPVPAAAGAQHPARKAPCPQGWARGSGCVRSPAVCPSQQLQPALGPGRQMKRETAPSALKFLPVPDLPPHWYPLHTQRKTNFCLSCWYWLPGKYPSFLLNTSTYCCFSS